MNWILGVFLVLVVVFLMNHWYGIKRAARLRKQIIQDWGKPKNEKYLNFDLISSYFRNNLNPKEAFHIISDKTAEDLNLNELFRFIDRTSSKIGQQYLYFKLRVITSMEALSKFDKLSETFNSNKELRIDCQLSLSALNSTNSYYLEELISGEKIGTPKILWLLYFLSGSAILIFLVGLFYPIIFLLLLPIFIVNMVFHYKNKDDVTSHIIGVSQLSKALKISQELASYEEIKGFFDDFTFIKRIKSIEAKTKFIEFEKKLDNDYAVVFWAFVELVKIMFNIEYLVFYSFLNSIEKEKPSINKMFLFIGEIDAAISTASLKHENEQICKPRFTKEKEIIVEEMLHPLVENCISNSLKLEDSSLLLTGSNMSGKTTFIRAMAINALLSQTFNFCFAKKYQAPFLKVFSSIKISDDLLNQKSYYLEEVLSIKELIESSADKSSCLFVLDELFKGTNTVERVSAGKAILSFLNKENNIVLVSTHDIELTDLLKEEKYQLYHFTEKIDNEKLLFDHKLKPGKLKTRNAIKILELYNYPEEITKDARKTEIDISS